MRGNAHTEEHPNDISDHLIVQDWPKRYLANHQLVQGWKWGLLWFVVVGVRQSLVGLICTRRTRGRSLFLFYFQSPTSMVNP